DIEWHWVKGHAGHPGNEMADQLANQGADETLKKSKSVTAITENKKKSEPDWLLDDPFGLDLVDSEEELEESMEMAEEEMEQTENLETIENTDESASVTSDSTELHPQIVITPPTLELHGPRQLILDTETTGFYYQDGDRIIEVGAIEMINRKLTGSSIHIYINPKKPVGDSVNVHGITDEFLQDKPLFEEISQVLFDYLQGAEIIAHNATFDMNFLDMEFKRAGFVALSEVCEVTDTLAMAKSKHPGQKNSLDALVRRYEIPQRDRTFHGALLDAEILSDVYLAMTGGQVSFDMDALSHTEEQGGSSGTVKIEIELPVILPSDEELAEHEKWVEQFEEKQGTPCLFAK
ncbi:MAG TPA: DNA polymerase III subunit epsilon, partial [Acinetobacter sp.]|nr:DNA polymerase III subunit epsilon [Acinetobacter sp.]